MGADASGLKRLALIPARGGSKRIPRKNIIDFHGKPMLGYSIDAALESGLFDRVHVSSDDDEVRAIAERLGASADPKRPAELADDHTGILPVARWALQEYAKRGEHYDDVFILFACAPFIESTDLTAAYSLYLEHDRKRNLLSVGRAPSYPERYYSREDTGRLTPLDAEAMGKRTQECNAGYLNPALSRFSLENGFWAGMN